MFSVQFLRLREIRQDLKRQKNRTACNIVMAFLCLRYTIHVVAPGLILRK